MGTNDNDRPSQSPGQRISVPPDGKERRSYDRIPVSWAVDYGSGDTFLFSYIANISAMGIFILSKKPLPLGAALTLKFAPPNEDEFEVDGEVAWVNPYREGGENLNPGMGVRFVNLDAPMRERLVELVRTIAYLPDEGPGGNA